MASSKSDPPESVAEAFAKWQEEIRTEVTVGSFWQRRKCKILVVVSEVAPVGQREDSYALVILSDPEGYGVIGHFYSDPVDNLDNLRLHEFDRLYPPFVIPIFAWADRPGEPTPLRRVSGVGEGDCPLPTRLDLPG